ncbi:hypothetical protein [Hyphomicrobium sp.]|uniref:hypothetical protein n=1 Tax=Hyphomicrobium sp. TaxID=82 RepID=UPI001E0A94C2|nr:hypothetical protein [Hyphomicrobium sp.]MBY0561478.1 hypothetical protein [Hyphomicrobium sp.]
MSKSTGKTGETSLNDLRREAAELMRGYHRRSLERLLPNLDRDCFLEPFADVLVSRRDAVANSELLIRRLEQLSPAPLETLKLERRILDLQVRVLAFLEVDNRRKAVA